MTYGRAPWILIGCAAGALATGVMLTSPAAAQEAAGRTTLLPAVSFSGQGDGNVRKYAAAKAPDALAGGYLHFWCTPGHWLEWTVEAPAAGEYQGGVQVTMGTMTPNFREFQVRLDGGEWKTSTASFAWPLRKGTSRLEARSVNQFGVPGPVSTVVLEAE